jgi:hypothetical protein
LLRKSRSIAQAPLPLMEQGSLSEAASAGDKANRRVKTALIAAGVLALVYVAAFYYLDTRNRLIFKGACVGQDSFSLSFQRYHLKKEKFWILNLRPGRILIETDQNIDELKLVTIDQNALPAVKVNDRLFIKEIGNNLVIRSIRLVPRDDSLDRINVRISRKPALSLPFVAYQFAFLFILIGLGLLTILSLYTLIIDRQSPQGPPFTTLLRWFVLLILVVFAFFVTNVDNILAFSGHPDPLKALGRSFLFNLLLAILLTALFLIFSRRPRGLKLPFSMPVLAGLPILFLRIPFDLKSVGDGVLWMLNLTKGNKDISFAESLSLMINKLSFRYARPLIHFDARTTLIYTGKIMGLLFILSLFCLINSFEDLSYKKKLLLFLLLLTFGFNVLLFGLPEFAYYPLPFLIFSVLSAQRYIRGGDSVKPLILSAFLAIIAGLFHGSAFISFPIILLLPLIKHGRGDESRRSSSFLKPYILTLITAGMTFFGFFMIARALGYNLLFNTAAGGFDGRRLISFLPENIHFPQAVNFIEIGYFVSRGWIFFITGAFIFLIFLFHRKKGLRLTHPDLILFFFGISQFLIILFWGFDLGVREFDLYIAPTALISIYLVKSLVGIIPDDKSSWKYILAFSLFSPAYLLAVMAMGTR